MISAMIKFDVSKSLGHQVGLIFIHLTMNHKYLIAS